MRKSLWQEELHKVRKEYKGHCTPLNEEKIKEALNNWYAGQEQKKTEKTKAKKTETIIKKKQNNIRKDTRRKEKEPNLDKARNNIIKRKV